LWRGAQVSVTKRQFAVLITVEEEGLCDLDVTARTGIDRVTIGEMVRRLVAQGLLRRPRRARDARAYVLTLTDQGRKVVAVAVPVARTVDAAVLRCLPPDRRGPFLEALRVIVAKLEG
jgi:DNA-binding MarR family transcriptional regulator